MRWAFRSVRIVAFVGIISALILPVRGLGQEDAGKKPADPSKVVNPNSADPDIQAINATYDKQRLELERRRLDSFMRLAARQEPAAAANTYEQLFRLAIANNLFVDAAPAAEAVLKNGSRSPNTSGLANFVKIIAECDRGTYEQSLESLRSVVEGTGKGVAGEVPKPVMLTSEKVELCNYYYQRLVHSDQLEIAKKAFQFLKSHVQAPALVEFVSNRLKRLELVGKPAPPIRGTDLDGKLVNIADSKGKVILVIFWASWCLPFVDEIEALQQVASSYRDKGFQIVGINLDHLQDDGQKLDTVMPAIRRFLLDYNVRWPTLINGTGVENYAEAYGVTAIPSNTLIGRDGKVVQIDLVNKNLDSVIARVTRR